MRSVIKTYQSMSDEDKAAFKQLQEEEQKRTGTKPTTAQLLEAVTPAHLWMSTSGPVQEAAVA